MYGFYSEADFGARSLGQKKNVHIHKLVIPKTVEERIQAVRLSLSCPHTRGDD